MDDTRVDKLEQKIDQVKEDIAEIKVSQAASHANWQEHMRRTDAVEAIQARLLAKDNRREGVIRFIAGALAVCAALEGIVSFLQYIRNFHA